MKRILALLLSVSTALGQVNVQKASGTNEISGSLVVGSGKTLTATGSGTIIATGGTATTVPWSGVTGTPTTLAGYGITSPLLPTVGGTGQSTWTLGDFLYANGTNTLAKLAGNTSATLAVLTQTGTGTVSAAPVWTSTTGTGNVVLATSPTLVTPISASLTAPASTALTLTGGSTGASLVLGQGTNADATIAYKGTGKVAFNRWVAASATAPAALAAGSGGIYFQANGSVAGTQDSWVFDTGYTDQSYRFKVAGTDRMVIAANTGNLLIGTTTDASTTGSISLASAGVGGPNLFFNSTNATAGNRYNGAQYSSGGVAQWAHGLRAGDGKFHLYDVVRDVSAITVSPGASTGVAGTVAIASTLPSTLTTNGALVVAGGVGVSGNIYAGSTILANGNATATTGVTTTGTLAQLYFAADTSGANVYGALLATNTEAQLKTNSNHALKLGTNNTTRVTIAAGGNVDVASTTSASSSTVGALTIGNGTAATNVAIGGGKVNIGSTEASGGSTSGALQVAGGAYIGGNTIFGTGIGVFGTPPSSGSFGLTIGAMSGTNQYGITDQNGSYTVIAPATEVMGHRVYSNLALGASGTLTNWYGFNSTLNSKTGAAVLTNAYAFYANSPTQATNNYAFYSAGTAPSVFGGTVSASGNVILNQGTYLLLNGAADLNSSLVRLAGNTILSAGGDVILKSSGATVLTGTSTGAATFAGPSLQVLGSNTTKATIDTSGNSPTLTLNSNTQGNYRTLKFSHGATPTTLWQVGYQGGTADTQLNFQPSDNSYAAVFYGTAPASTTTSGALQTRGGLGVSGAGYFGGLVSAPTYRATSSNLSNATSTGILDFALGAARLISYGADASTPGGFSLIGLSSDGSAGTTRLAINSSGYFAVAGTNQLASSWRTGSIAIGPDGQDKVVIGPLISTTNGPTIGGHATGLGGWAPINVNGSTVTLRIGEGAALSINASSAANFASSITAAGSGTFGGTMSITPTVATNGTWNKTLTFFPVDAVRRVHTYSQATTGNTVGIKWVKDINGTESDMWSVNDLAAVGSVVGTLSGKFLTTSGGLQSTGSLTLGATYAGIGGGFQLDYTSPVTTQYFGDGTGFSMVWATRAASTTTPRMTLTDAGNLTVHGIGGVQLNSVANLTWGGAYGPGIPAIAVPSAGKLGFYPNGSTSGLIGEFSSTGLAVTGAVTASGTVNGGIARITPWALDNSLAYFGHSSAGGAAGTYGMLHSAAGNTQINGASTLTLNINNSPQLSLATGAATFAGDVSIGGANGLSITKGTAAVRSIVAGGSNELYQVFPNTGTTTSMSFGMGSNSATAPYINTTASLTSIYGAGGTLGLTIGAAGAATFAGAVSLSTAGTTVSIKSGTNAAAGTVTLVGGAGTITSTAIDVNTVIVMSIKTKTGSFDHAPSVVVAAGSATIDGHNADDSTYNWIALKVN